MSYLLVSCISIYIAITLFLYVQQRKLIYFPVSSGMSSVAELQFTIDEELIRVIQLNPGMPHALIYFGGNAELVERNVEEFSKHLPELSMYLVNYRGYGGSSGEPSEEVLNSDAVYLFDQISANHRCVSVMGRSLGSGVATYVAANRNVSKLILVTPFDSLLNVAKSKLPIFPISLMLRDKYNSISRVKQIDAPTLIISAEHDQVILSIHTKRLADAFPRSQLQFIEIKEEDHNTVSQSNRYYKELKKFLYSEDC